MPYRCAFGCLEKGVLHGFPNPDKFPERFKAWVHLLGGKLETSSDYEFYKKKRICELHFIDEYRNRFKRLNAKAIPTLLLPETQGDKKEEIRADSNIKEDGNLTEAETFNNYDFPRSSGPETQGDKKEEIRADSNIKEDGNLTEAETFNNYHFPRSSGPADVKFDHCYGRHKHEDHTYWKPNSYHTGPSIDKTPVLREFTTLPLSEVQDDKKEENKVDSNIQEADNLTEAVIFDNDDLPQSPEPEFTTETVSDIGENIINEDSREKQLFSWQKTELIVADESDDVTPALVPEQPKTYEDLTLSLFCDEPETPPLSPELCELVAVVPEEVESRCKDCASVIVGFSFWCVQCRRGATCCACAARAPHDAHHVLRAPRGAAENRTLDILTVIRQQLLNENLISQHEIDEGGIKVEVKQEDEECPSPPPEPAATPDPLAVESHPELYNVELHSDRLVAESHPDADSLGVESHSDDVFDECLDGENIEHDHPFKRPRLMERSQTLKLNSTAITNYVQKYSTLNVPSNIVEEPPTVQTLPCDPRMPQDVVLATTSGSSGPQVALNITTSDPSGPRLLTTLQNKTSEQLGSQAALQVESSDEQDVLLVSYSDPQGAQTVMQIDPGDRKRLQNVLKTIDSDPKGSESAHIDPSDIRQSSHILPTRTGSRPLIQAPSSRTGSKFFQKTVSSDRTGSQTLTETTRSIVSRVLQKVFPADSTASQSLPKVTASDRTESELVMMRTREMFQGSDFSGSKTYKKIQPRILKKTKSFLMLEKVQGIPKGAAIIKPIDNDSKTCFKVPLISTRGVSVPLKVTSGAKSAETVITNLDDVDMEAVEFLEKESEETGYREGDRKCKDSITQILRVVNEHFNKKRKVEYRMDKDINNYKDKGTSDKAPSDKVRESELEDDGNQEDIEDTRTEADSVTHVRSEVDDSDLDKDYAVEDDKSEESPDDTVVESISERGVSRRTRNATKTPVETPSQAMLRMLTSKAVVQVKPLTSLEIRKWMANSKRPRKD